MEKIPEVFAEQNEIVLGIVSHTLTKPTTIETRSWLTPMLADGLSEETTYCIRSISLFSDKSFKNKQDLTKTVLWIFGGTNVANNIVYKATHYYG